MSRIFRACLEDETSSSVPNEEAGVIMNGPLADVYAQALDIALAKDGATAEGASQQVQAVLESFKVVNQPGLGLETAQMDSALMQSMANIVSTAGADSAEASNATAVYAVAPGQVDEETVVQVTQAAADAYTKEGEFVLIVDATQPGGNSEGAGVPVERIEQLGAALEGLVTAMGGKVYHSLKEFAQARFA